MSDYDVTRLLDCTVQTGIGAVSILLAIASIWEVPKMSFLKN